MTEKQVRNWVSTLEDVKYDIEQALLKFDNDKPGSAADFAKSAESKLKSVNTQEMMDYLNKERWS